MALNTAIAAESGIMGRSGMGGFIVTGSGSIGGKTTLAGAPPS